jgi:hypothetical protein
MPDVPGSIARSSAATSLARSEDCDAGNGDRGAQLVVVDDHRSSVEAQRRGKVNRISGPEPA